MEGCYSHFGHADFSMGALLRLAFAVNFDDPNHCCAGNNHCDAAENIQQIIWCRVCAAASARVISVFVRLFFVRFRGVC
mgnify:CR=1 FL=1